jgi:hypothetical protein
MAVGLASGVANSILDALVNSNAWSEPAGFFVKLHLGDPGAAGTSNPATETDRVAVTGTSPSGGACSNSNDLDWPSYPATETISHVSFWSASTAGTFLGSDALNVSKDVDSGDDFQIAVGELDLSLTPIAA